MHAGWKSKMRNNLQSGYKQDRRRCNNWIEYQGRKTFPLLGYKLTRILLNYALMWMKKKWQLNHLKQWFFTFFVLFPLLRSFNHPVSLFSKCDRIPVVLCTKKCCQELSYCWHGPHSTISIFAVECEVPLSNALFFAPLYLRTLWRYTNAVIIIIIIIILSNL